QRIVCVRREPWSVRMPAMTPRLRGLSMVMIVVVKLVIVGVVPVAEERMDVVVVASGVAVRDDARAGDGRGGGESRQDDRGDWRPPTHARNAYHTSDIAVTVHGRLTHGYGGAPAAGCPAGGCARRVACARPSARRRTARTRA